MGTCLSKQQKNFKKKTKDKDRLDDVVGKEKRAEKKVNYGKKSRKANNSDRDSSSDTSSSSDACPAKVSSSKYTKRKKDGSIVMVSTKTIVGGDHITIGGGSNVIIGASGSRKEPRKKVPKQSAEPSKPNFSTLESKTTDVSRLPGCFMQLENMSVKVIDQEVVTRWKESVGQIRSSSYFATAFRVGPNYIMTAKHVLDGILDSEYDDVRNTHANRYTVLENSSVHIDFGFLQSGQPGDDTKRFQLTRNVAFEDVELDVAVIKLQRKPDVDFPEPFTRFSHALHDKTFFLMGHPNGSEKQLNEVKGPVQLNEEQRRIASAWSVHLAGSDGFIGVDHQERLLFHCSFQKGASGSPGIAVRNGKEAVVVTMLLRGFPDWKYDPSVNEVIKAQVGNNQCIEQGVSMYHVYEKMHQVNIDLCVSIFGQVQ